VRACAPAARAYFCLFQATTPPVARTFGPIIRNGRMAPLCNPKPFDLTQHVPDSRAELWASVHQLWGFTKQLAASNGSDVEAQKILKRQWSNFQEGLERYIPKVGA
jgi:hypothetical protein